MFRQASKWKHLLFSLQKNFSRKKKLPVLNSNKPEVNKFETFEEQLHQITQEDIESYNNKINQFEETIEHSLSTLLFDTTTTDEVLNIYKNKISQNENISQHELCLLFYFANIHEGPIIDSQAYKQLFASVSENMQQIVEDFCDSFILSLSNSFKKTNLNLNIIQKNDIARGIINALSKGKVASVSNIMYQIPAIFHGEENKDILDSVNTKLIEQMVKNIKDGSLQINLIDVLNAMHVGMLCDVKDLRFISTMAQQVEKSLDEINEGNIAQIIYAFSEPGYRETDFFDVLHELFENHISKINIENLSLILIAYSKIYTENPSKFSLLLSEISKQINNCTITSYINLWLALAKIRSKINKNNLINALIKKSTTSGTWTFNDFEPGEFVNIFVAMSALQVDNVQFLNIITTFLDHYLKKLSLNELYSIATCILIYSNQAESFFMNVHSECVTRLMEFNEQETKSLKKVFTKRRSLFPYSPFIDISLYQRFVKFCRLSKKNLNLLNLIIKQTKQIKLIIVIIKITIAYYMFMLHFLIELNFQ